MRNMMQTPPWYVLTGGPCSGKTTLINELKDRGYSVLPEAARVVIAAQLAEGKTIEQIVADPLSLQHVIIGHKLELQGQASTDEVLFLDRGVPDDVAYYRKFGLQPDHVLQSGIERSRYRKIFLLDMIEFTGDAERYESPEEATWLHEEIGRAYRELGYEVIQVPVLPVSERADFVLACL